MRNREQGSDQMPSTDTIENTKMEILDKERKAKWKKIGAKTNKLQLCGNKVQAYDSFLVDWMVKSVV